MVQGLTKYYFSVFGCLAEVLHWSKIEKNQAEEEGWL